jgi:AcrR family transcriptional regulator
LSPTSTPHSRQESGTRGRTRRAILAAATSVLARDPSAPLTDIAKAAQVGRATLHRYFSDRAELHRAVVADCHQTIKEAVADAAPDHGDAREALRRLVTGFVDAGDRILFLYGAFRSDEDETDEEMPDATGDAVISLIRRGQEEGVFTRDLEPDWIENVLWALVFAGCEVAREGRLPRHGVASTIIRTLEGGIVRGE